MINHCIDLKNMFSRFNCIFPIASSPFQKFSCITVGTCMTVGGSYFVMSEANKYMEKYEDNKITKKENNPRNSFLTTMNSFFLLPLTESNNPYSVGMSVPLLGAYSLSSYVWTRWWYYSIKRSMSNVKHVDQCCKLVRMSIIGTIKHSSFMLVCTSNIVLLGLGFYITCQNGYNIINNK